MIDFVIRIYDFGFGMFDNECVLYQVRCVTGVIGSLSKRHAFI